eukprot:199028_1
MIYNANDENKNNEDDALMNMEIINLSEEQKRKRDRILWTRFIKQYRNYVNEEYNGNIKNVFDENNRRKIMELNEQRINVMNSVNPRYIFGIIQWLKIHLKDNMNSMSMIIQHH